MHAKPETRLGHGKTGRRGVRCVPPSRSLGNAWNQSVLACRSLGSARNRSVLPRRGSLLPRWGSLLPRRGSLLPHRGSLLPRQRTLTPRQRTRRPDEARFAPKSPDRPAAGLCRGTPVLHPAPRDMPAKKAPSSGTALSGDWASAFGPLACGDQSFFFFVGFFAMSRRMR